MSILEQLPSQTGTRTQEGNVQAAERCLEQPALLDEIVAGVGSKNARLAGDCAEVMTKVAERQPELVAPHARILLGLLAHKNGRVRWESAHALALVSSQVPNVVHAALPKLRDLAQHDGSVIVRDYVLDAIAGYGATSTKAAAESLPVLREGLEIFESKHAARVLRGLGPVAKAAPKLGAEIRKLAEPFQDHAKPGIRKEARALLRSL